MRSRVPSQIRWTKHRTKEELLEDPLAEGLYGLFLKVKDSPRHISIKPEVLINEVYYVTNLFYQDTDPSGSIDLYAHEIESDLGWRYAADLVMIMAYALLKTQKSQKKLELLLHAIENKYRFCCYWDPCHALSVGTPHKKKPGIYFSDDLSRIIGKNPIIVVSKVDQINAIYGNNAKIQK